MIEFLAIPIVRKIGAGLLVVAAISAVAFSVYHAGKRAGQEQEAGKETEANKAQFDQVQQTFKDALAAGAAREKELAALATSFANLAAQASSRVQAAQQASVADRQKIAALPDSAVKSDLELKLGGPLENITVLRRADDIVTDYPHKLDELKAEEEKVKAVEGSLATAQQQTATVVSERDAAISAFNQLLPLYTQAYNAAIRGHRKWYCLFLCKKKSELKLPEPASLMSAAAKVAHR